MAAHRPIADSIYQTITPLGRGGMGEVFLAAMPGPPGLNQLAVIKRIWPELADEADVTAMFLSEARLALRLRHRNVVQTYEVGQEVVERTNLSLAEGRGGTFIAMEYLAGQPLSQVIRVLRGQEAFTLQLRLYILSEVLNALEYAHELRDVDGTPLGVVHRDISPHNVIITYDGAVKLMDFGIAKSLFASHQTRPGVFRGRFAYGAPEQILGYTVDRRADLFAVGVMLWELLAEQRLFQGRTEADIVRILSGNAPPPPFPDDREISEELKFIVARALALHPTARYQTAAEFRRDLLDVLGNCLPPEPRPLGRLVACTFRNEKQTMEAIIHRFFHGPKPARPPAANPDATLVDQLPSVDVAFTPEPVPLAAHWSGPSSPAPIRAHAEAHPPAHPSAILEVAPTAQRPSTARHAAATPEPHWWRGDAAMAAEDAASEAGSHTPAKVATGAHKVVGKSAATPAAGSPSRVTLTQTSLGPRRPGSAEPTLAYHQSLLSTPATEPPTRRTTGTHMAIRRTTSGRPVSGSWSAASAPPIEIGAPAASEEVELPRRGRFRQLLFATATLGVGALLGGFVMRAPRDQVLGFSGFSSQGTRTHAAARGLDFGVVVEPMPVAPAPVVVAPAAAAVAPAPLAQLVPPLPAPTAPNLPVRRRLAVPPLPRVAAVAAAPAPAAPRRRIEPAFTRPVRTSVMETAPTPEVTEDAPSAPPAVTAPAPAPALDTQNPYGP